MAAKREFLADEATRIGEVIGVDWTKIPLEQFRQGLAVELEHGSSDSQTDVTNDDLVTTGKIALAHLKEFPDYYDRLAKLEKEADEFWSKPK